MNIFSHRKEINVLKWRKTSPIIWGKKGFVSKMPFLLLSFLEKGPKLLVSFTTPPTHLPKDAVIESDHVFYPIFLTKEQKKKKESWDLLVSGCSGRAGGLLPESKSISLDQASPRLQASSIYLRIIENYIFETENYI